METQKASDPLAPVDIALSEVRYVANAYGQYSFTSLDQDVPHKVPEDKRFIWEIPKDEPTNKSLNSWQSIAPNVGKVEMMYPSAFYPELLKYLTAVSSNRPCHTEADKALEASRSALATVISNLQTVRDIIEYTLQRAELPYESPNQSISTFNAFPGMIERIALLHKNLTGNRVSSRRFEERLEEKQTIRLLRMHNSTVPNQLVGYYAFGTQATKEGALTKNDYTILAITTYGSSKIADILGADVLRQTCYDDRLSGNSHAYRSRRLLLADGALA